jgi:hypothetical protein
VIPNEKERELDDDILDDADDDDVRTDAAEIGDDARLVRLGNLTVCRK